MTGLLHLFWECDFNRDKLNDLIAKYILPYLVTRNIITSDEEKALNDTQLNSRKDATEQLMTLLLEKDDETIFEIFVEALRSENAYPWIAKYMEKWRKNKELHDDVLLRGVVPFPLQPDVGRKPVLDEIKNALYEASKLGRSWIVVHGMLGIGKTVLAAKALRNPFISECFPGGIFWIAVGKAYEDNQLLLKMQALCDHFNKQYRPDTIERCYRYLREVATDRKRALLILDDVWSEKVLSNFDIGWTVLVTTRDEAVTNGHSHVTKIFVNEGFTLDESRKFFASKLNCRESDLPEEVMSIHNKYKGNPFALSLIGSQMKKHGNDKKRWQLRIREMEKDSPGRRRKNSANTNNILQAVELSLEDLDPELRKYYEHFALFFDDLFISGKVFEVLWDVDAFEAKDILEELVQKSLLIKVTEKEILHPMHICKSNCKSPCDDEIVCYGIHDILLDYLQDHIPKEELTKMHKKLVENYLKLCDFGNGEYDFRRLPDDDYIHFFLAHHIYKADVFDLFPKIFLDLRFVECKLRRTGPADLIHDYSNYGSYFIPVSCPPDRIVTPEQVEKVEKEKRDFERFIRQKAHLLSNNREEINLYQLALQEASTSAVYQRAWHLVQSNSFPDNLFFRWCNASESPDMMLLSAKPHSSGSVNHIVFSPDNSFLVSVGEDRVVRLLEAHSGRVFQEYTGHEGSINYCCITPSGDMIATAASDRTVRLWIILKNNFVSKESTNGPTTPRPRSGSFPFSPNPNNEFVIFEKHQGRVLTCSFSHNEELVVSGSSDGIALVWKKENGELVQTLSGHNLEITCCRFSKDDKLIATSSRDSLVFIWCTKTWNRLDEFGHGDSPAVYCEFMNDSTVVSAAGTLVRKWKMGLLKPVRSYNNLKTVYSITCCALSPEEIFVAGGTSLKYLVVWATKSGDVQATLKGHCDTITCVNYSSDGTKLVSASCDGAIFVWDMQQASKVSIVSFTKMSVQFKDQLPHIAILNEVNSIQVFKGMSGKSKHCFDEETEDEITCCCLSPDYENIFYGTRSGALKVYNILKMRVTELTRYDNSIEGCLVTANGKIIAIFQRGVIKVLDARKLSSTLKGHTGDITQYEMFCNDSRLVSCSQDGSAIVWDLQDYTVVVRVVHGTETVTSCDASRCGRFLASASVDGTVKVWNSSYGQLLFARSLRDCVRKCRFSPCAIYLAVGTDEGDIEIVEWEKNVSVARFAGHRNEAWVYDLHFSPDSNFLVSASNSIKWWRRSGDLLCTFVVKGGEVKKIHSCERFEVFVAVDNVGVLYILERIL